MNYYSTAIITEDKAKEVLFYDILDRMQKTERMEKDEREDTSSAIHRIEGREDTMGTHWDAMILKAIQELSKHFSSIASDQKEIISLQQSAILSQSEAITAIKDAILQQNKNESIRIKAQREETTAMIEMVSSFGKNLEVHRAIFDLLLSQVNAKTKVTLGVKDGHRSNN